ISVLFFAKRLEWLNKTANPSIDPFNISCPLQYMGQQFVFLILTDYAISIAQIFCLQIYNATIPYRTRHSRPQPSSSSSHHSKSPSFKPSIFGCSISNDTEYIEFELSEEYIVQLTRFYIVCLGMFVVPFLLPAMVVVGNSIE